MIGITGHKGYVGSAICEELSSRGVEYVGIDLVDEEDILDFETLLENFDSVDCIIHLAAISGIEDCESNPRQTVRTNIRGTLEVAKFCQQQDKRLVFASSFAVNRQNLYGESKRIGEIMVEEICSDYLIFRKSNIYGGEKPTVINYFVDKWRNGETLTVHRPGTQKRDFIHLNDVVDAYISATNNDYIGRLQLCSGEAVSVKEVAKMISEDYELVEGGQGDEIYELETDPSGLRNIGFETTISIERGIEMMKNEG